MARVTTVAAMRQMAETILKNTEKCEADEPLYVNLEVLLDEAEKGND